MHDSLSDKYQVIERWFASNKDELGGDAISEHIGALCAVFQPAASLLLSLARNKMAAGELWRVHFESISSLLLVASALRAELSISDAPVGSVGASGSVPSAGEAAGGAKPRGELLRSADVRGIVKDADRALMRARALETDRRTRKAFDAAEYAGEAQRFRTAAWVDLDLEKVGAIEALRSAENQEQRDALRRQLPRGSRQDHPKP